jgi:hypothetical protein
MASWEMGSEGVWTGKMTQRDLFDAPEDKSARCGLCVHRNAVVDGESGACSPKGERGAHDPPCSWFFGRLQLRLSLMKRP